MRSTPLLLEASTLSDYVVHLRFEDGTLADVDLSHLPRNGGVFASLSDPSYFGRFQLDADAGTIVWPNGADIAPETLYARAREALSASI